MTLTSRTLLFVLAILLTAAASPAFFREWFSFALQNEFASLTLFVPPISLALILRKREIIFKEANHSFFLGGTIAGVALILLIFGSLQKAGLPASDALSAKALLMVVLWIGMFLICYGTRSFDKALFPMLFLLLMVPIPQGLLDPIIVGLQRGSAAASAVLFKLTGTPFYRDGVSFALPGMRIEIASQCSSIRSSLALLISCLLAGHLVLRQFRHKLLFALVAVPMAMVKNAIRIVTLSLLSIHIDKRWIVSSDLHHEGGIVFFVTSLLLLWPVLWLLRRAERGSGKAGEPQSLEERRESQSSGDSSSTSSLRGDASGLGDSSSPPSLRGDASSLGDSSSPSSLRGDPSTTS